MRRVHTLGRVVALCVCVISAHALAQSTEQTVMDEPEVAQGSFPTGWADFDAGVAYVPNDKGSVDAIALKRGKRLWRAAQVNGCAGTVKGNPLCWRLQGKGERATLTLHVLDRKTGKSTFRAKPLRNDGKRPAAGWLDAVATGEVRGAGDSELVCLPGDSQAAPGRVVVQCHLQAYVQCTPRSNEGCVSGYQVQGVVPLAFDAKTGALTADEPPAPPPEQVKPLSREGAEWGGLYFDLRAPNENLLPRFGVNKRVLRAMRITGEKATTVYRVPVAPERMDPPRP